MIRQYRLSAWRLPPLQKRPALKKYGEMRPDLSLNDPNCSTLLASAKEMNCD